MNKENAHEYLPLVQALSEGKTLQVLLDEWEDYEDIEFDNIQARFIRIKPTPRTFKLYSIDTVYGETIMTTHPTFDSRWKQITVQEVPE